MVDDILYELMSCEFAFWDNEQAWTIWTDAAEENGV